MVEHQHQQRQQPRKEIAPRKVRNVVNLRRLLERCEEMVFEKNISWRLGAYVEALEDLLETVKQQDPPRTNFEQLNDVRKRIGFIKGAIQMAAAEPEMKIVEQTKLARHPEQEVRQRQQTKVHRELRKNLLAGERKKQSRDANQDVDQILREQHATQRQITETMISFAQNLKRNARAAKEIIAKDTEVAKLNLQSTEDNFGKLKIESVRLEEQLRSPCSFQCMMWIMLAIVILVFPCMVIFIRLFPKRF